MFKKIVLSITIAALLCSSIFTFGLAHNHDHEIAGNNDKTLEYIKISAKKYNIDTEGKSKNEILLELYEKQADKRKKLAESLNIKTDGLSDEQISEELLKMHDVKNKPNVKVQTAEENEQIINNAAKKYEIDIKNKKREEIVKELFEKQQNKRKKLAEKLSITIDGLSDEEIANALVKQAESSQNAVPSASSEDVSVASVQLNNTTGWYEYYYLMNYSHEIYYYDPNDPVDPYTIVGFEPCTLYYYNYNPNNPYWECQVCYHDDTVWPSKWYEASYVGSGKHLLYYIDLDNLEDPTTMLGIEECTFLPSLIPWENEVFDKCMRCGYILW